MFRGLVVFLLCLGMAAEAEAAEKYLRFPDVLGDQVVFSYGGDLWRATTAGGTATRLTAAPGLELFAKFSPDGKWIAFTGQYGGDEQVYVIPANGGEPRQLTHFPAMGPLAAHWGYDNRVVGWAPDGKSVLFLSYRDESKPAETRLYTVPLDGGAVTALPMERAGAGVFSPDGKKLLFTPANHDFRTWKHYEGGWVQNLYIADLASRGLTRLSDHKNTDRDPVWNSEGIYFLSDRAGQFDLYKLADGKPVALTHFKGGDAKFASGDRNGHIVFEYEGSLHLFDAATSIERELKIDVPAENANDRPHVVDAAEQFEDAALSPDAKRVLLVARGDIFVRKAKGDGATLNLTHSSNAHDREAAWSADGKAIAFVSDASGEEELWLADSSGQQLPRQLTHGGHIRYYAPLWSPDGRHIALLNANGDLLEIDTASGAMRQIGSTKAWYEHEYSWSANSRYLVYAELQPNDFRALKIWDSQTGRTEAATDPLYDSFSPVFSSDGRYLWFLSVRDVALQISQSEWNYAGNKQTRIFALALQNNGGNPFDPDKQQETKEKKNAGGSTIDFNGLVQRLVRAPLEPDNYEDLDAGEGRLIYRVAGAYFMGRDAQDGELYSYDLSTLSAKKLKDGVLGYYSNAKADAFLVRDKDKNLSLVKLTGEASEVARKQLMVRVTPRQEWKTVFDEVRRRYRDFFFDPKMQGLDWNDVAAHYEAALPAIGSRSDLNYLMGEMIAELRTSHAYVRGGEENLPGRPHTGLLGARLVFDKAAGKWAFFKIFAGDSADPQYRSPLTEVGTEVRPGEYLLAIDGEPLSALKGPYDLLGGKAEKLVLLTIADAAGYRRNISIKTLASEANLIFYEQTQHARQIVDRASGGAIGYIRITDMGPTGLRQFVKDWYGQIRKDGMIIDIRGNAGGNVSRMILERLIRPAYTRGFVKGLQIPQTYPWGNYTQVFTGEMDMLVNGTTMSDGDTMAWTFKTTGRGKLIGKRTWGGVIGIGDTGPLLDGGEVSVPQFALLGPDGAAIVEGTGVSPDIDVDNDEAALKDGSDAQLLAAIADLKARIHGHPGSLATHPGKVSVNPAPCSQPNAESHLGSSPAAGKA